MGEEESGRGESDKDIDKRRQPKRDRGWPPIVTSVVPLSLSLLARHCVESISTASKCPDSRRSDPFHVLLQLVTAAASRSGPLRSSQISGPRRKRPRFG